MDQAHQPSQRAGAHRRRDRSRRAEHQQGEAGNLAGHEADPGQPLGQGGRALSARHAGHRHRAQPDQLRRLHRDRRRDRRPAARQRHVVDPQDQPSQRGGREGPEDRVQGALGRSAAPPHRPGAQAAGRRSLGNATSPASISPARSSPARSPSSPTSACSSAWRTAWKACCTSRSWPTTRSRTPRRSSRSATRSRSRFCASTPDERKIGLSRKRVDWAEEDSGERRGRDAAGSSSAGASTPATRAQGRRRRRQRSADQVLTVGSNRRDARHSREIAKVVAGARARQARTAEHRGDNRHKSVSRQRRWSPTRACSGRDWRPVVRGRRPSIESRPRDFLGIVRTRLHIRRTVAKSTCSLQKALACVDSCVVRTAMLTQSRRLTRHARRPRRRSHLRGGPVSAGDLPPRDQRDLAPLGRRRAGAGRPPSATATPRPATAWSAPTCGWSSTSPAATPARAWACRT